MAPRQHRQDPAETQTHGETPKSEQLAQDLDAQFQAALARGEIEGDIVMVDEEGNEVKRLGPHKTIFDP